MSNSQALVVGSSENAVAAFASQPNVSILDESKCNSLKFKHVCMLFERIKKAPTKDKKLDEVFHPKLKALVGSRGSLFPLLRVLLPSIDEDRTSYGLKESSIAKLYVNKLALSTDKGSDGYDLINWKKGGDNGERYKKDYYFNSKAQGDFCRVLGRVIEIRAGDFSREYTLGEVNQILDSLVAASPAEADKIILEQVLTGMSANEQIWFWRIVLKDLKIGLNSGPVFERFYKRAQHIFNNESKLRSVCDKVVTNGAADDSSAVPELELFNVLSPMLAKGFMNAEGDQVEKVVAAMAGDSFTMDIKLDGERMLVHKQGNKFKMYTRNGTDYSDFYRLLGKDIVESLDVDECILDGEVIAFARTIQGAAGGGSINGIPFGHNKTVAERENEEFKDGITWANNTMPAWLQYAAFDIVYIRDSKSADMIYEAKRELGDKLRLPNPSNALKTSGEIIGLPLILRRALLERIIPKPMAARFNIVKHKYCFETSDEARRNAINDYFDLANSNGEEGLVVKQLNSKYYLGAESRDMRKWIKMKMAYGEPISKDLMILGAYNGTGQGFRAQGISTFLLGAKDEQGEYKTVVKVGTGYNFQELKELRERLMPKMQPFIRDRPPDFLAHWKIAKSDDVPDYYIEPDDSVVMEVKFDSVIPTIAMSAGVTLRFPRVYRLRYDKNEIDPISDFIMLVGQGPVSSRNNNSSDVTNAIMDVGGDNGASIMKRNPKKRQKMEGKIEKKNVFSKIPESFRLSGGVLTENDYVSYAFDGVSFCIYGSIYTHVNDDGTTTEYKKEEVEYLIRTHRGNIVLNPVANCKVLCLVADFKRIALPIAVKNVINQGLFDIYLPRFVIDSATEGALVDPRPTSKYFLHCCETTRVGFGEDAFGDSVSDLTTFDSLLMVYYKFDIALDALKHKINSFQVPKNGLKAHKVEAERIKADLLVYKREIEGIEKKSWRILATELNNELSQVSEEDDSVHVPGSIINLFWDPDITYSKTTSVLKELLCATGARIIDNPDLIDENTNVIVTSECVAEHQKRSKVSINNGMKDSLGVLTKVLSMRQINQDKVRLLRESFVHESISQKVVMNVSFYSINL